MPGIQRIKRMGSGLGLNDAPEWNSSQHIKSGYRKGGNYWDCFFSLFWLHNETINIWTMIIGVVVSSICVSYIFCYHPIPTPTDYIIFILYCIHGLIHVPFSVANHLFGCMDRKTFFYWRKMDISFIFISASILCFVLSFYVFPVELTILWTIFSVYIAYIFIAELNKNNSQGMFDRQRASQCVGYAVLIYIVPIGFQAILEFLNGESLISLYLLLFIVSGLGVGGYCYATEFPERLSDVGRFDLFLHGHNIMHFGVMMAHWSELIFVFYMFQRQYGVAELRIPIISDTNVL